MVLGFIEQLIIENHILHNVPQIKINMSLLPEKSYCIQILGKTLYV